MELGSLHLKNIPPMPVTLFIGVFIFDDFEKSRLELYPNPKTNIKVIIIINVRII